MTVKRFVPWTCFSQRLAKSLEALNARKVTRNSLTELMNWAYLKKIYGGISKPASMAQCHTQVLDWDLNGLYFLSPAWQTFETSFHFHERLKMPSFKIKTVDIAKNLC